MNIPRNGTKNKNSTDTSARHESDVKLNPTSVLQFGDTRELPPKF